MRVVFMGTPEFAVPSLRALASAHDVALVITRPDAVRGRGRQRVPSAVRACADELGLPTLCSARVTPELISRVADVAPGIVAVAAFGAILPDELLALPSLACVNVHASLLPRWRGAAPIQRAILAGDDVTGVSIMRMAHDLDAGAYCRQARVALDGRDAPAVTAELAELGATELLAALADMGVGRAVWTEQDEHGVTYAAKVTKAEMRLDPSEVAVANVRRVLASTDAAPARLVMAGRGVRVLAARVAQERVPAGEALVEGGRVLLGCAEGSLEPLWVRPDGRSDMGAAAWAAGLRERCVPWCCPPVPGNGR